ncbi:helix-turn-helix domain-containing protein [Goodfellowiella coeruleoviolacea]|uniref:Helix-turn-helix domain-containing protein n=1 Tax=Goodfellowiella coeruleoviolacea TaxID=334858 RepID=A0AAE3GJR0_9PSEU|nr:helix-turn-helix transcriptional regulator [Goodfellowiella coeruleoviolacea]MCP2168828.1 Helix-turn-helix domain-containing protein [Goodfellowiella coeruleoviolacea]
MGEVPATVQGRDLALELRARREAAKLCRRQVMQKLGWDMSKVSRFESGKIRFRETDVIAWLAVCGVTGEERERLLAMVPGANQPDMLNRYRGELRENLKVLIRHEWEADTIYTYEPLLVPGLLQIPEYTRELGLARGHSQGDGLEQMVQLKQERQRILSGAYPTRTFFYVSEVALRRQTRNPVTMRNQLLHLLFMSPRPSLTLRVVPQQAGLAAPNEPLVLMDFPERSPVAYQECTVASLFLEQKVDIDRFRDEFKWLAELALSEAESREFLAKLAGPSASGRAPDDLPIFEVEEE